VNSVTCSSVAAREGPSPEEMAVLGWARGRLDTVGGSNPTAQLTAAGLPDGTKRLGTVLEFPVKKSREDATAFLESLEEENGTWATAEELEYRAALQAWLKTKCWETFFTGTFADKFYLDGAKVERRLTRNVDFVWRCIKKLHNAINEKVFGKRWEQYGNGTSGFYVLELQQREALHVHAVLGNSVTARSPGGLDKRWLENTWKVKHNHGIAMVLPAWKEGVEYVGDCVPYLTKDVYGARTWNLLGWQHESRPELPIRRETRVQGESCRLVVSEAPTAG